WSAHRRKKSAANTTSTSTLRIATRSVSRCVTRYPSATAPLGRSNRRRGRSRSVVALAKQLDLRREIGAVEWAQQPAHERVHGRREDEVQHDRRTEAAQHCARGRALAEHEVHEEQSERVEDSYDR